jgi:6-phosphogluconolactonase (cycloisomerase 2 family)
MQPEHAMITWNRKEPDQKPCAGFGTQHGAYPRHISFDPTGTLLFAANQNSGSVTVFHVDQDSGALTSAGAPFAAPTPVCVLPV